MLFRSRGDWVHKDSDEWVGMPDGTHELLEDCVELANGDWCLEGDAWQCAESGEWFHDDDEYVEIDGNFYHPDSKKAQEYAKRGSHEHQIALELEAA